MSFWKIALSLALLASAAPFAAAQGTYDDTRAPTTTPALDASGGGGQLHPVIIVPGKWQIETVWEGNVPATLSYYDGFYGSQSQPIVRKWKPDGSDTYSGGRTEFPNNGVLPDKEFVGVSVETAGKVTITYTWVSTVTPFPQNARLAVPPKTLTLREDAVASASQSSPGSAAEADNGMGDPATPSPLSYGSLTSGGYRGETNQRITHLTTHQVTNNKVTIVHSLHAKTNSVAFTYVLIAYQAVDDTRTLSLKRNGARGETVDSEGNTHGDTTYSYFTAFDVGFGTTKIPWANEQQFESYFSGGWSKTWYGSLNITWNWSPSDSSDDWGNGHTIMPYGQEMLWVKGKRNINTKNNHILCDRQSGWYDGDC